MKKILVTALALAALAGLAAGITWAVWTAPGLGSGNASSGNASLVVSVGSAVGLYPGGTVQVPVDFYNTSDVPIALDVTSVSAAVVDPIGCGLGAAYAYNWDGIHDHDGLSHVAQGGMDTGDTIAVTMAGWAGNTCQGQTFTVNVSATGTQH